MLLNGERALGREPKPPQFNKYFKMLTASHDKKSDERKLAPIATAST